ncbi:MAG: ACP S-malonyltransferase [Nanoarchaeota archaeon]
MKNIALIFPGQGSLYQGMGKSLCERSPAAKEVFHRADAQYPEFCIHLPLSKVAFEAPDDFLQRTDLAQPVIFTHSCAAYEALRPNLEKFLEAGAVRAAGLSIGEYAALYAAQAFNFEDGLQLVKTRGWLMLMSATGVSSGLLSIGGLDEETVRSKLCNRFLHLALLNAPGQYVVGGNNHSLDVAIKKAQALGARKIDRLKVPGAFHTSAYNYAARKFVKEPLLAQLNPLAFPVVANVDARYHEDGEIRDRLVWQINSPVDWIGCTERLLDDGVELVIELGPKTIASGLVRRTAKATGRQVAFLNVDDAESLDATIEALAHYEQN